MNTLLLLTAALTCAMEPPKATPEQARFFESKVRPVLAEQCFQCHGEKKQNNGLRLDSLAAILKGGDSGPALVPGKPDESLLLKAVRRDEELKMPPKEALKPDQVVALSEWIKMGAPWPDTQAASSTAAKPNKDWWAFQPLKKHPLPAVTNMTWPKNSIDHFVLARMETKRLTPVGQADKRTLIRRATFDLTGLPPTPEEIDAFLADDSPDAYARLLDRLLAAPAYGERWGRHWLDVVRYADTAGDNSDYPVPQLVKYRDWVIRAFNNDKPYDQFLREQLAGDLMPSTDEQDRYRKIIATGYLASARRFGSVVDGYPWHLTVEDTIDNLGRTILGLTINCARCHDHKFDPITSEDYYALYGFFQSTRYPWPGIELDKVQREFVPLVPPAEVEKVLAQQKKRDTELEARLKRLESEKAAAEKALKEADALTPGDEREYRRAVQREAVDRLRRSLEAARKEKERLAQEPLPFDTAYAVADGDKKVGNARLHTRGDPEKLGKEVPRRFVGVLGGQTLPTDIKGSGRLELAKWLTDPKNPLTPRVMVNRIWQHHFGKGIVPTPSDFGKQGQPPSHPELLDHLALEFIDSGWSIKAMHRLIMLSQTYQLSSDASSAGIAATVDPDNVFLWRHNRRRLEAETIRDSLLAVSGGLDRSPGEPHSFPKQTSWDFTQHKPFKAVYDSNRRSVYLMTQRIARHPFLALFDGPDTNASTAARVTSTTPLQALFLMNDPFVHEQARRFAARLIAERPTDEARIERAYLLTYGRPPTSEESAASVDYLAKVRDKLQSSGLATEQLDALAWESYCRVVFMSSEFVYVN